MPPSPPPVSLLVRRLELDLQSDRGRRKIMTMACAFAPGVDKPNVPLSSSHSKSQSVANVRSCIAFSAIAPTSATPWWDGREWRTSVSWAWWANPLDMEATTSCQPITLAASTGLSEARSARHSFAKEPPPTPPPTSNQAPFLSRPGPRAPRRLDWMKFVPARTFRNASFLMMTKVPSPPARRSDS